MPERPFGACGDPAPAGEGADRDRTLTLVGRFPDRVPAGSPLVGGEVVLRNDGPLPIGGLSAVQPDVVLVRAGRIVAIPLARDDLGVVVELEPGAERTYQAWAALVDCAAGGPLAAGGYELHARLEVHPTDGDAHVATGGPWPLELT